MPAYSYKCPGCGDVRDIIRGFNDPEETFICTQCDCEFQRQWSTPTVIFNGSGFYSTDNRK